VFNLFPKDENFFALFKKQAAVVREGCHELHDMMVNFDRLEARAARLKEIEHQGDLVTHDVFERLNKTFITPLEREDIHNLASGLDDVLDSVEAIGSRVVLFSVKESTPQAVQLCSILDDCGQQIEQAIAHLQDFKGLMGFTIELNRLENQADVISRHVVADLFSGKHDVMHIMRWKELYGRMESAADQCEDVANTIEAIVLKSR